MRYGFRFVCVAVFWLLSLSVHARVHLVKPGEIPKLGPDEGLALLVVDSNASLREVKFRRDGKVFDAVTIRDVGDQAAPRLFVLPAGTYEWSRITTWFGLWYEFRDKEETRFRVEPGVVSYPGDLLVRGAYTTSMDLMFTNRGLQAMDWLDEQHPAIASQYRFRYTGFYEDPFPAFYREAMAASGKPPSELMYGRKPPRPPRMPVDVRELWRAPVIDGADLNGRGDMLIKVLLRGDGYHFEMVALPSGKATPLMVGCCEVESMQWAGNDVFVVSSRRTGSKMLYVDVFRFSGDAAGGRTFEHLGKTWPALYVQVLPEDPEHILVGSSGERGRLRVHRVGIRSQAVMDRFQFTEGARINRGVENDRMWFADGAGRLRLAIASSGEEMVLMHGIGGQYQEVMRYGLKQPFSPMLLSYDGELIYGLSDDGREQRDLVAFDPHRKEIVATLFSKPGIDVVAPVVDAARRPIGAAYFRDGHLVTEYFDERARGMNAALSALFPGKDVAAYDRADNGDLLAWVSSSTHAGGLYHVDAAGSRASIIEAAKPWLKGYTFAESELKTVVRPDGIRIEAYLTRPLKPGRHPLVVLSHGGPIGVRDARSFDPEVQTLAALGYAVLQVNFRGSDGFGTAFRESGRHAHGTLIEDDIDLVLRDVIRDPGIDPDRMCVIGSSYGGYSALISTIRWPDRFRCAVSISGVADWMLFFTASDGGNSAQGRQALEHYIGNPKTDRDAFMANSPIFRYRELKTPLLLVHGAEDTRVDYEHMRRLVRMLNIAGVRPTMVTLPSEGHSISSLDSVETAWTGIAGFLAQYLGPDAPTAESPAASVPSQAAPAPMKAPAH